MKNTKIFLASSLKELERDRFELGCFFGYLNKIYLDKDIHFNFVICEDKDKAISRKGGKQEEYNEEIKTSDMVFFLFSENANKFTKEEFKVAADSNVYSVSFARYQENGEISNSVREFLTAPEVDGCKYEKQYYHAYGTIDTLKLSIVLQLMLTGEYDSVLDIKDGKLRLDGHNIAKCYKIPLFNKCRNTAEQRRILALAVKIAADRKEGNLSAETEMAYFMLEAGDFNTAAKLIDIDALTDRAQGCKFIYDGVYERPERNRSALAKWDITSFFLSSVTDDEELAYDRVRLGNFFRVLNDIFYKSDIYNSLSMCDNDEDDIPKTDYSKYDKKIADSSRTFFLFGKDLNDRIEYEFNSAFRNFHSFDHPKITTYIKSQSKDDMPQGKVKEFLDKLYNETNKHYYSPYINIEDIQIDLFLNILPDYIMLRKSDIDFCDGELRFMNKTLFEYDKAAMFGRNSDLHALRDKLTEIEKEYDKYYNKKIAEPNNREYIAKYREIREEKYKIETEIYELEMNILDLARKLASEEEDGSHLQHEAKRRLKLGDYNGALEVMNDEAMRRNTAYNLGKAELDIGDLKKDESDYVFKANMLKTYIMSPENIAEINKNYEAACELVRHTHNIKPTLEHAEFLRDVRDYSTALEKAELLKAYSNPALKNDYDFDDTDRISMYALLGELYDKKSRTGDAIKAYKNAIELHKKIYTDENDTHKLQLIKYYTDIASVCYSEDNYHEAQEYLLQSVSAINFPDKTASDDDIAKLNVKMGKIIAKTSSDAMRYFGMAIDIYENNYKANPDKYSRLLAEAYCGMGSCAIYDGKDLAYAEHILLKAYNITKELYDKNPALYMPDMAEVYAQLGKLHLNQKSRNIDKAKDMLNKSLKIRQELFERDKETYAPLLAEGYSLLGEMYDTETITFGGDNDICAAIEKYSEALKTCYELAEYNYQKFAPTLAEICDALGNLYLRAGVAEKAEPLIKNGFEIYSDFCAKHISRYEHAMAQSYQSMGSLYHKKGDDTKAENYYKESVKIVEQLNKNYVGLYKEAVANCYMKFALFYFEGKDKQKAIPLLKKVISLYKELSPRGEKNIQIKLAQAFLQVLETGKNTSVVFRADELK